MAEDMLFHKAITALKNLLIIFTCILVISK